MMDIAKFFWDQAEGKRGKIFVPSESLKNWKGMNSSAPTFSDLCDGIIAVAETLEQLGEFGTVIKYRSAKEFRAAVVNQYEDRMKRTYNSSKFKKAETPAAIAVMNKTRDLIDKYVDIANKLLK